MGRHISTQNNNTSLYTCIIGASESLTSSCSRLAALLASLNLELPLELSLTRLLLGNGKDDLL